MNKEYDIVRLVLALKRFYNDIILRAINTGSPMITRQLIEFKFQDLLAELDIDIDELS